MRLCLDCPTPISGKARLRCVPCSTARTRAKRAANWKANNERKRSGPLTSEQRLALLKQLYAEVRARSNRPKGRAVYVPVGVMNDGYDTAGSEYLDSAVGELTEIIKT